MNTLITLMLTGQKMTPVDLNNESPRVKSFWWPQKQAYYGSTSIKLYKIKSLFVMWLGQERGTIILTMNIYDN